MCKNYYSKINEFILKYLTIIIIICAIFIYKKQNKTEPILYSNYAKGVANYRTKAVASLDMASNIYTTEGSISLSVNNVEKAKKNIDNYARTLKGITERSYFNKFYNKMSYNVTYKIPNDNVEKFVENIKNEGKINNQNISIKEISDENKNTEQQLNNLYARKNRLENLLSEKKNNTNIEQYLAVEKELSSVMDSIRLYENNKENSIKKIEYTTISLNILPNKYLAYPDGYEWTIKDVYNKNIVSFIIFTHKCISILIKIIIFMPYILLAYLLVKLFKKIYKQNEKI